MHGFLHILGKEQRKKEKKHDFKSNLSRINILCTKSQAVFFFLSLKNSPTDLIIREHSGTSTHDIHIRMALTIPLQSPFPFRGKTPPLSKRTSRSKELQVRTRTPCPFDATLTLSFFPLPKNVREINVRSSRAAAKNQFFRGFAIRVGKSVGCIWMFRLSPSRFEVSHCSSWVLRQKA